jgi:hypothetical protein
MTKQQTAVEMLVEYMEANFHLTDESREVFKKALRQEKIQRTKDYQNGRNDFINKRYF